MSLVQSLSDLSLVPNHRRAVNGLRSRGEFQRLLAHERACSDRNEHEFSLLVFQESSTAHTEQLVATLTRRIRQIDVAGWLDSRQVGVLLPYTPSSGAKTLAEEICRRMGTPPNYTVYTYPDSGFSAKSKMLRDSDAASCSHFQANRSSSADAGGKDTPVECGEWPYSLFAARIPIWKRTIDILGALIGLIFLSPLLLLIAIVIKAVSPGPAFLKQNRPGRHRKMFTIWKFRTMRTDADVSVHQSHLNDLITGDGPLTKLDTKYDPRIFPFGKFIRRCYLDELPQLINVLRGEMSLVGPRPCLPYEVLEYKLWQTARFDTVPGMTGLWQVSGKNRTTYREMLRLDIAYSKSHTFWLDLSILLKTVPAILLEILSTRLCRKVGGGTTEDVRKGYDQGGGSL